MDAPSRPLGITLLSLFFAFGAVMSGLTFFLLCFPGSRLDISWRLNPRAHESLSSLEWPALLLMSATSLACATAAVGLWRCARWGLWIALAILLLNLLGDSANAIFTGDLRPLIGLPIGGSMLFYLIWRRKLFSRPG